MRRDGPIAANGTAADKSRRDCRSSDVALPGDDNSATAAQADLDQQPDQPDGPMADRNPGRPPRVSATRSLRRLLPYARPALPALAASTISAMAAMLCGVTFPLVIRQIIDGPAGGDLVALWPLAGALLVLGVFEAALFRVRRMLAARPTVRVEAAMRGAIYDHLQRLPVSFHDRWPAGQWMSRAVSDLTTIRRFLAFG